MATDPDLRILPQTTESTAAEASVIAKRCVAARKPGTISHVAVSLASMVMGMVYLVKRSAGEKLHQLELSSAMTVNPAIIGASCHFCSPATV